ncbi:hypothetical protein CITRIK5_70709 [Citricoccus sp. K5]|nr:hypothetical protein CITRIK5_70709 [Citricoccus sp. K5]
MIGSEAPTPEPIIVGSEAPGLPLASSSGPSLAPIEESLAAGVTVGKPRVQVGTVLAQLETIPVKGRAPQTGYDRDLFGSGWQDPDANGCDARNDILGRDLTETIAKPGTHGCVITSGVLQDPFTGEKIDFVRGQDTSTLVQIDHVVALSDAWQKGAQLLEPEERAEFANDPLNLLAVDGPTNAAKGDGDAATWLPPNHGYRCNYVARQSAVKAKYDLWMTQAEHDAIRRIVSTQCPAQKVATE